MTLKVLVFFSACLLFFSAAKAQVCVSTKINLAAMRELNQYEVGTATDLTKARIVYKSIVEVGMPNEVLVETNPPVYNATIYLNVSNPCKLNGYADCIQRPGREALLSQTQQIHFKHIGRGIYQAHYTISVSYTHLTLPTKRIV
eukprot:TRINITY_DN7930_c0_g4_i2.p1 TRINITY_DN7930_c0_g4~~TRINITY_DN7930_c0_g4_i2.p1  ORF type:complete len:144 (+),score=25.21 TRINITY_DN7930_c0_g4_i2:255-686(+)